MAVNRWPRLSAWALPAVLLALHALVLQTAAQVDPSVATVTDGPIKLSLVAAYGPGLVRPADGPTLIARRLNQKKISCQLASVEGVKARAVGVSAQSVIASTLAPQAPAAVLTAAATAAVAAPRPRAACRGSLQSGRYTLVASYIQGATFAQWNCYPVAPGDPAAAAALDPALSLPMEGEVVELPAGGAYTCVATYSKASKAAVNAASLIDWDAAVETAAATAAPIGRQGCTPLSFNLPRRAAWAKPLAPLGVKGNRIYANSAPLNIKGINWFGFNVAMGMVDGLWAGGSDYATDFGKITFELKLLGYNAVRLPFTFNNLANTKVWDLVRECAPLSQDQLKRKLIDPNDWNSFSGKALPGNPAPVGDTSARTCNGYLPSAKNEDRFLFVIQQFVNMGMYVILDYQPMGTEQHAYNLDTFVQAWTGLWRKVMCLPNFETELAGRVLVDVMNEPDSMGIRWEAQGDRPGAQQLYLGTADALWAATPNGGVRFMFEGTGQNSFGLNWGNGFVTDPNVIQSRGLSNPTAFFKYLVRKPYVKWGASIISPHVYPPTITGNTFLGQDLWSQCTTAFGYLMGTGFCADGTCTQLPILVGETGSSMAQATDVQWLHDFADYLNVQGGATQYTSTPASGWLWWAYNENSGDTGGIVTNQWQDIHWSKVRFMMQRLGLQPWYKASGRRGRTVDESGTVVAAAAAATAAVEQPAVAEPVSAEPAEPGVAAEGVPAAALDVAPVATAAAIEP